MEPTEMYFFEQSQGCWQRDSHVTFLCMAARFGDVSTLKKLLQEILNSDRAAFMSSPAVGLVLKRATQAGQVAVLACLVEAGIDINTPFKGASALHEAVKVNNLEMLRYLLKVPGVQRNMLSLACKTPLMEAACRGRVECLSVLLDERCSVHDRNDRGRTALHYCLLPAIGTLDTDDMIACLDLLFHNEADINNADDDGCTLLHVAIETDNLDAVLWLLHHNCQLNVQAKPRDLAPGVLSRLETSVSMTPLLLVVHFSNRRLVQLLVACGASCYGMGWTLAFCSGYELLHHFLTQCVSTPHSLQFLCRTVVRQAVGRNVDKKVISLNLPVSVQRYLLLTDELNNH